MADSRSGVAAIDATCAQSQTPDASGSNAIDAAGTGKSHDADASQDAETTQDSFTSAPSIMVHDEPQYYSSPVGSPKETPSYDRQIVQSPELHHAQFASTPRHNSRRAHSRTSIEPVTQLDSESYEQAQSHQDQSGGDKSAGNKGHSPSPDIAGLESLHLSNNSVNPAAARSAEMGNGLSAVRGNTLGAYSAAFGHKKGSSSMSRNSSFEYRETLDATTRHLDDGSRIINQYKLCDMIGRGAYGCVYRAIVHNDPSDEVAVKEFGKTRLRKNKRQANMRKSTRGGIRGRGLFGAGVGRRQSHEHRGSAENDALHEEAASSGSGQHDGSGKLEGADDPLSLIRHEIAILKKLHHPHLVQLYEVLDDPKRDSLYMVFEYCPNGTIIDVKLHEQTKPLDEKTASKFFIQIMLAVEYLHYHGIVHRDIKPDNILLLRDNETCKIVDFGVSEFFVKPGDDTMSKSAGSPAFMSPELCKAGHGDFHGKKSDIWSMGVTLYCMVAGRLPFDEEHFLDLYEAIQTSEPEYPEHLSSECVDFLKQILRKDPKERITIEEMRNHPWISHGGEHQICAFDDNIKDYVVDVTQEELDKAIIKIASVFTFARAISKFKRAGSRGASISSISDIGKGRDGSRAASSASYDQGDGTNDRSFHRGGAAGKADEQDKASSNLVDEAVQKLNEGYEMARQGAGDLASTAADGTQHVMQSVAHVVGSGAEIVTDRRPEILGSKDHEHSANEEKPKEDAHSSRDEVIEDDEGNTKPKVLPGLPTVRSPALTDLPTPADAAPEYFGKGNVER